MKTPDDKEDAVKRSTLSGGLGFQIKLWNVRTGVILGWPFILILDAIIVLMRYDTWVNARAASNYDLRSIWNRTYPANRYRRPTPNEGTKK